MAPSKTQLPVLLPRRSCAATDSTLSTTRISPAKRVNTTTTPTSTANHALHHQVIVALTNLQGGLTHVQTGLNDLFRAYMQHTSSILAGENSDMDMIQLPANISATANAAMEAAATAAHGMSQVVDHSNQLDNAVADTKSKKRKREKKEKDPNAPKKPLTAAFLYAQTARPIVRSDIEAALGEGQAMEKNAVNLEVTKRWNELPDEDKEVRPRPQSNLAIVIKLNLRRNGKPHTANPWKNTKSSSPTTSPKPAPKSQTCTWKTRRTLTPTK
jgi:hypothetical protein